MRQHGFRAVSGVMVAAMLGTTALAGCSTADSAAARAGSASAPSLEVTQGLVGSAQIEAVAAQPYCSKPKRSFRPRTASALGVAKSATVVAPPRTADGLPGAPPLTDEGKQEFAWDRQQGIRPGDPHGHVLFNAHTWPDGTALGNRMLANLHVGDKIIVRGKYPRQHLCYRVIERVKVPADRPMPRYYRKDGAPRLAIVTCSGKRLGPGNWTHRTVWFAAPLPRFS